MSDWLPKSWWQSFELGKKKAAWVKRTIYQRGETIQNKNLCIPLEYWSAHTYEETTWGKGKKQPKRIKETWARDPTRLWIVQTKKKSYKSQCPA